MGTPLQSRLGSERQEGARFSEAEGLFGVGLAPGLANQGSGLEVGELDGHVDGCGLDCGMGLVWQTVDGHEGGEFLLVCFADDEVPGGEAVAGGVAGYARLAFEGARSGRELGVGLVGGDLGWGCHKIPFIEDGSRATCGWQATGMWKWLKRS